MRFEYLNFLLFVLIVFNLLQVCKDIPVEKCHPVPEKVAKQIPKKVSHQVCEDYGYAGHSYGYDRSDDDVKEDNLKLV